MLWSSFSPTPLSAGSGNDFDDSGPVCVARTDSVGRQGYVKLNRLFVSGNGIRALVPGLGLEAFFPASSDLASRFLGGLNSLPFRGASQASLCRPAPRVTVV
jgi:hypothetical protein